MPPQTTPPGACHRVSSNSLSNPSIQTNPALPPGPSAIQSGQNRTERPSAPFVNAVTSQYLSFLLFPPPSFLLRHVKALESRSELLDAALQSADEANRRWEECRALVDQLRVENAALRAAVVAHAHLLPPNLTASAAANVAASSSAPATTSKQEDHRPAESATDPSTDSAKK